MERPYRIPVPEPRWPWLRTALRITLTFLMIWGFMSGSSPLPLGFIAVLAVVNVLAILLAYELSIRDVSEVWIAGLIFTLIGVSCTAYGTWQATRPPPPSGPLLPATDPTPHTSCVENVGPNNLVMAFGANRAIGVGPGPFRPLQVGNCTVMALRRVGRGLMVNAFFYDWNNDVAFFVNDNVYEATMPLQLRSFRPDPHTIVILDRFDKEVLYLRYLNFSAVRIRGRFLCGQHPQAIIRDSQIFRGGIRIGGAFLGLRSTKGHACKVMKANESGIVVAEH